VTGFLYEYPNTRNQSLGNEMEHKDPDNFFNHSIYVSGYTYHRQVMGSPLFFPVVVKDNISEGIRSNRFFAHHVGMMGNFLEHLSWKALLTSIEHWGTYKNSYNPYQKQVSGLLEMQYVRPGFPVELGLSITANKETP
jgi:hypothetical protein